MKKPKMILGNFTYGDPGGLLNKCRTIKFITNARFVSKYYIIGNNGRIQGASNFYPYFQDASHDFP